MNRWFNKMVLNKAEKVLEEIEKLARKKYLLIVGRNRGRILVNVIREVKPKRVLEIGTFIGYSTILIGKELETDAQLITIEIDPKNAEIAKENIRRAEIPPKVEVLVGDAREIIPRLEGKFDLVFIDAEKDQYLEYLQLVENKLHKGSIIIADNAEYAPSYLHYVRSSGKYSSKFVDTEAGGLEISIKL